MKNEKKIKDAFTKLTVSKEFDDKVLGKTINKKNYHNNKLQLGIMISSVLLVCLISISVVYAKEIKEIINSLISPAYKYETYKEWDNTGVYGVSKDAEGVHTISINGKVEIKSNANLKSFGYKSISDVENNLGIRLLKSNKFSAKYISAYRTTKFSNYHIDSDSSEPEAIEIRISNHNNDECYHHFEWTEAQRLKCWEETERPDKQLTITIRFLTQHAPETVINNFKYHFADFPGEEKFKTFDSRVLNTTLFINGFATPKKGEDGLTEMLLVYDNIAYHFFGAGFSSTEIIKIIESMKY